MEGAEKVNRDKNLTDTEVAGQGPDFIENFTPLEEQDEELKGRTYPVDFTGATLIFQEPNWMMHLRTQEMRTKKTTHTA